MQRAIQNSMEKARKHPEFHSIMEAFGVIREEYLELEQELIKKKVDKPKIKEEGADLIAAIMKLLDNKELVG